MQIRYAEDVKIAGSEMHDSEFGENDFNYDPEKKLFHLISYSREVPGRKFSLELYNVEKYNPSNLDKIRDGKATGGVFNYIEIKNDGLDLALISQDLKIKLNLSKLDGKFESIKK